MPDTRVVEVRVYGSHRRLLPSGDVALISYQKNETLRALLARLDIPYEEIGVLVVNNIMVNDEYVLFPGDKVAIMSPVGGG